MKKHLKLLALSPVLLTLGLASCVAGGGDNSSGSGSTSIPYIEGKITVNFYVDFNQVNAENVYYTVEVENGSKVSEPTKPTEAPLPEFPVFIGWSKKEVVDDKKDLWDFSKDVVVSDTKTFSIYGIWVAEGEN